MDRVRFYRRIRTVETERTWTFELDEIPDVLRPKVMDDDLSDLTTEQQQALDALLDEVDWKSVDIESQETLSFEAEVL